MARVAEEGRRRCTDMGVAGGSRMLYLSTLSNHAPFEVLQVACHGVPRLCSGAGRSQQHAEEQLCAVCLHHKKEVFSVTQHESLVQPNMHTMSYDAVCVRCASCLVGMCARARTAASH